jgi:hypothetical protein
MIPLFVHLCVVFWYQSLAAHLTHADVVIVDGVSTMVLKLVQVESAIFGGGNFRI